VRVAAPKSQDQPILTPPEDWPLSAGATEEDASRSTMHEIHDLQVLVAADGDEASVRRPQAGGQLVANRDRICV